MNIGGIWNKIVDGNHLMIIIFWEMTPCGSYKNRRFGGSYRLHLQGEREEFLYPGLFTRYTLGVIFPESPSIQELTVSLCTCSSRSP
jgi:hypothetical protein